MIFLPLVSSNRRSLPHLYDCESWAYHCYLFGNNYREWFIIWYIKLIIIGFAHLNTEQSKRNVGIEAEMVDLEQDEDKKRAGEDVMAIVETTYQINKLTYYLSCIAINYQLSSR